ncbi:MAG: MATE family efflux transporter [Synergistaceae bacterium]|jgi:putative MATE family efflux protein|nr:MATE family efflux transporter [Synergistaceae bacterium]
MGAFFPKKMSILIKASNIIKKTRFFIGKADLGNDSPMSAILKLAIPSIGLFVFNTLLHLVDTIFVSWLGELPTAAMSFTGPINMCVFATLECVANGSIAIMGRCLGRKDVTSARHVAKSGLSLLYVVCLASTPLLFKPVSNALFSAIGAGENDTLLRMCWLYNMWIPLMLPFMGYTYMANTVFRAQGNTLIPFKAISIANAINIVLDPLFIFTFGWGIAGAAIATWISRIASSIYLMRKMKENSAIMISPVTLPQHWLMKYWKPILWIGVPVGLSTASTALGMGSVNRILSQFGHRAVSSWMLGLRVEELAFNFLSGITIALTPYVAFNYGKRDPDRMIAGFKSALLIAFILVGSMGILIYSFPRFFLSIFKPMAEIETLASRSIRSSVPGYPFNIFLVIANGFFVGTGYSVFGTITQMMRSIVFRISAAWIFSRIFTLEHIWWFQSLSFFLASFVSCSFFMYLKKKLRKELTAPEKRAQT